MKLTSQRNRSRSIFSGRSQRPCARLRPYTSVFAFVAVWALPVAVAQVAPAFPKPQGYVNDFAGILNSQVSAALASELQAAELQTTAEIVVVTVPSTEGMTIEDYANRLFNQWGIGKQGKDNGVLVVVAPSERHVRIEVGYGLEPVLPDGLAGEIIHTNFLPGFRRGDYADGILTGVRRIIYVVNQNHALTADESHQFTTGGSVQPPWVVITLVVGVIVVLGAFLLGLGLAQKPTAFWLLLCVAFGVVDVLILFLMPLPAISVWSLRALGLGILVWGFVVGRSLPRKPAPRTSSRFYNDSSGWASDSPSGSSDSGGSSGGDFGGGSSGGGGASGSW